jgi:hypothetical protein
MLYFSLIYILIYGIHIWSAAAKHITNFIATKQKIAIRIITNAKYIAHTEPIFKSNKILPLYDLTRFFKCISYFPLLMTNSLFLLPRQGLVLQPGMTTVPYNCVMILICLYLSREQILVEDFLHTSFLVFGMSLTTLMLKI